MFFYHHNIWGFSGESTERVERFNKRKKAKPKIKNLAHLRDKEEHLQAKNSGDVFRFPVGKEPTFRWPCTSMTSSPYWSVQSGPRQHRRCSVQDGHVGHQWWGFSHLTAC